jgi:death on curing protein
VGSPVFLDKEQVLELHEQQIEFFGGKACIVRDDGLLESAVLAPINYFCYTPRRNLFDLAACYAFHLSKNHAFVDGNKRIAFVVVVTFLRANGITIDADWEDMATAVTKLSASQMTQAEFSVILQEAAPLGASILAELYLDISD